MAEADGARPGGHCTRGPHVSSLLTCRGFVSGPMQGPAPDSVGALSAAWGVLGLGVPGCHGLFGPRQGPGRGAVGQDSSPAWGNWPCSGRCTWEPWRRPGVPPGRVGLGQTAACSVTEVRRSRSRVACTLRTSWMPVEADLDTPRPLESGSQEGQLSAIPASGMVCADAAGAAAEGRALSYPEDCACVSHPIGQPHTSAKEKPPSPARLLLSRRLLCPADPHCLSLLRKITFSFARGSRRPLCRRLLVLGCRSSLFCTKPFFLVK